MNAVGVDTTQQTTDPQGAGSPATGCADATGPNLIPDGISLANISLVLEQVQDMFSEIEICGFLTDQDEVSRRGRLPMIAEINLGEGWAVPSAAEAEDEGIGPDAWPDVPSIEDTLHIPLKYHKGLAKGDPGARRVRLTRGQLGIVCTAHLEMVRAIDEYRWLVKMTVAEKAQAVSAAIQAAWSAWEADPKGALERLAERHGRGTPEERQDQLMQLLDGTSPELFAPAISGGLFGLSLRRRKPQRAACPIDLDFAARVRDVRFPLLAEFVVNTHCELLCLAVSCGVPDPALAAALRDSLKVQYEAFSTTEQALLAGAGARCILRASVTGRIG